MKENLFIIGGSGFIGKNLTEYFINKFNIYIIDKFIDVSFFSSLRQKIKSEEDSSKTDSELVTIQWDLSENKFTQTLPDPDYIVNLASVVTADRNLSLFDSMISSNLKVLMNLYDAYKESKHLKLFVQFGSSEEYGNVKSPYIETMREQPDSPYSLIKQLTVNTSLMLFRNYGFPVTVVRPGNLFGKYQNTEKFIPYIITKLKKNDPIDVTLCEQKRDFIYAEDFAWCISEIITHYDRVKGEIINVASGESIALKDIIETLKKELNSSSIVNYGKIPYRENEAMDLRCNIDKFENLTSSKITFNVKQRFKELAEKFI
ncbi:MAG: NAD-dependent epimerase/dehydratase family protein [Bacteroidales bacterium]|nr:NAD-dependent epimerase/dehydratase family protein [Bacteroidales bacterium]